MITLDYQHYLQLIETQNNAIENLSFNFRDILIKMRTMREEIEERRNGNGRFDKQHESDTNKESRITRT